MSEVVAAARRWSGPAERELIFGETARRTYTLTGRAG